MIRATNEEDTTVSTKRIGIIMHGVTGRMGMNQHLIRSVLAIRDQGGIVLADGTRLVPDPIIVGRNGAKVAALAKRFGVERVGDDLDAALANPDDTIFFDAASTKLRPSLLRKAIDAGKHVYSEKPVSEGLEDAIAIARYAKEKGVKNGIVHDKLDLPGLLKLKRLRESGFFGRILSVKGEFGYWVFEGDWMPAQRPSWNYRAEDGGGMISDMLCHWRYVLDNVVAPVKSVSCLGATHISERVDEQGRRYKATADDAAYASFLLDGPDGDIVAHINSSWCTRVYRDDLVTFQIDGTHGSAIAGLHSCKSQHRVNTPKPVWNPDEPQTMDFQKGWEEVPDNQVFDNGFKVQWEQFLRHVVEDGPWHYTLLEGAKGVQLAEAGYRSSRERRWVDLAPLEV
ncbi:Gfo/Idh/MocA family protein [Sinorhizobium meliloti]|uniref:Gfo/Idh/MocA family protein n=1 Tax=Rhizobium meliloti TaxID=382 RepID=UPI00299E4960